MLLLNRTHVWPKRGGSMQRNLSSGGANSHDKHSNISLSQQASIKVETNSDEDKVSPITESIRGRATSGRLPPRSRTGCWTCRKRKVKCDEKHPVCGPCLRLQQHCDYEPRFEFRDDTQKHRSRRKGKGIDENGCPPWDGAIQRSFDPRLSQYDDMAPFQALNSEDEWERKAGFHRPGTYNIVANQDSFASLPEYSGSGAESSASATTTPIIQTSGSAAAFRNLETHGASSVDPHIVILEKFEGPSEQSPQDYRPPEDYPPSSRPTFDPNRQMPSKELPVGLQQPVRDFASLRLQSERQRYAFSEFSPTGFHPTNVDNSYVTQQTASPTQLVPRQQPLSIPMHSLPRPMNHHPQTQPILPGQGQATPQARPPVPQSPHQSTEMLSRQLSLPSYPDHTQAWPTMPTIRRTYTQIPGQTGQQIPPQAGSQAGSIPRHLSLSLSSGSGSVLEEISGMVPGIYDASIGEEAIEDWEEDIYLRQR